LHEIKIKTSNTVK